ncbi:MAG: DUF5615 family PIN-like protein, partial [Gemmatimonadota bacterium]
MHVQAGACDRLRDRGVDAVHAITAGFAQASDAEILEHSIGEDRIVVTRSYRHFAPLVEACVRHGRRFPGVLFLSPSIPPRSLEAHVQAIER